MYSKKYWNVTKIKIKVSPFIYDRAWNFFRVSSAGTYMCVFILEKKLAQPGKNVVFDSVRESECPSAQDSWCREWEGEESTCCSVVLQPRTRHKGELGMSGKSSLTNIFQVFSFPSDNSSSREYRFFIIMFSQSSLHRILLSSVLPQETKIHANRNLALWKMENNEEAMCKLSFCVLIEVHHLAFFWIVES